MPVTLYPATHPSRAFTGATVTTAENLLKASCPRELSKCKEIIQSSFENLDGIDVHPSSNGFIKAVYAAYSQHHHLTIRPEDVWFAILAQLSFHINAHAEDLRSFFVSHEGQKEIQVSDVGTIHTVDFGKLAIAMTHEMENHVNDPDLRAWIMPDFTTTTTTDLVTAAVLMMGTMQKYFSYTVCLTCGIPSVTLLGEKDDWTKLRNRIEKLPALGKEPEHFASLLRPVLDNFVRSVDDPTNPEVLTFWSKVAHMTGGSGVDYLSGWITAFCFWDADGKCLYSIPGCELDGTIFHQVDTESIPDSFVSVPVKVDDNGTIHETRMVAGSVGVRVTSSGQLLDKSGTKANSREIADTVGLDSVQPLSGWWMYELV